MRAKAGTVAGALIAAMTITKGLPMSYNRDLQELTPHLWRGVVATRESIPLLAGMIGTATFDAGRMAAEAGKGFSTATELADTLTRDYGLAFRTAHRIVGRAVRYGSLDLATLEAAAREAVGLSIVDLGVTEDGSMRSRPAQCRRGSDGPWGPAPRSRCACRREDPRPGRGMGGGGEAALLRAFEDLISESRR